VHNRVGSAVHSLVSFQQFQHSLRCCSQFRDSTKSIAHVLYTRAKQIDGVVDNKETVMVLVWQLHELHFIILRDVSICPYGIEYAKVIPQNLDNFMKWGVGLGMNVVRKMMEDGRKWLKNLEINKIMLIFAS